MNEKNSEEIDEELNQDMVQILNRNSDKIQKRYPEGSFARLFWEEQQKASSGKKGRQNRWHPLMLKWCLNLQLLSGVSYHTLRTSGFIVLPSERTLRDFTHFYKCGVGFSEELNSQLRRQSRIDTLPESRRYISLIIDEMKIKEDLVYDKNTGQIVGFTQLGEMNDTLAQVESKGCTDDESVEHPPIADHMMVLFIRGLFFKFNFPYAHFPTRKGIVGKMLFPIVWEAIRQLEAIGFKVISVTADGASPNRKFFKMNGIGNGLTYKTHNPYADPDENRSLYFISDVPHLIKTTRNCWSHSGLNGTRLMAVS